MIEQKECSKTSQTLYLYLNKGLMLGVGVLIFLIFGDIVAGLSRGMLVLLGVLGGVVGWISEMITATIKNKILNIIVDGIIFGIGISIIAIAVYGLIGKII